MRANILLLTTTAVMLLTPIRSDAVQLMKRGKKKPKDMKKIVVIIETEKGNIKIKLFAKDAPKTVKNFVELANKGYYDGLIFHRVIPRFMIQSGDPTGAGRGGKSIYGKAFEDEINAKSLGLDEVITKNAPFYHFLERIYRPELLEKYRDKSLMELYEAVGYEYNDDLNSHKMVKGSVAMANSGPNTNSSQFFIVSAKPQPHLDGKHTVFGKVIEGIDIVNKIEQGDKMTKVKVVEE